MSAAPGPEDSGAAPSFRAALNFWWRLGWISFGGPAGQIAIMHAELVERKRWVDERRFLEGLDFCMMLPGPEAQQLATYLGWRLHGWRGGFVAGGLFVLPSILVLWLLSYAYLRYGARPELGGVLLGLKAAVLALIIQALLRLGRKVLNTAVLMLVALLAWYALAVHQVPFPALIAAAALAGVALGRFAPAQLGRAAERHAIDPSAPELAARPLDIHGSQRAALACLIAWLLPIGLLVAVLGPDHVIARMGLFFSQAALITFGGAYAVLPYVAQQAVEHFNWLDAGQMMVGLGLAETTPGPLIMVLEFVGFTGAWTHPGALPPLLAATFGALVTVWATFMPSFALVFAGAPWIERLGRVATWRHALATISAAVLGVIANLALWFGAHAALRGDRIDWNVLLLAMLLSLLLLRFRASVPLIVLLGAVLGALLP